MSLQKLNNILLDIITIMARIKRDSRAEFLSTKRQLQSALISMPAFAERVEEIKSLNALYQFAEYVKDEIKTAIKIEKEK